MEEISRYALPDTNSFGNKFFMENLKEMVHKQNKGDERERSGPTIEEIE